MHSSSDYVRLFNESIRRCVKEALRISLRDPAMAVFILRTLGNQNRAARTRAAHEKRGIHVPPFMIVSITNRCNLRCKGCYSRIHHQATEAELSVADLQRIIAEASELGVSIILLAGGEPLTRPEILGITRRHPEIVFLLFTNGMLLDQHILKAFRTQRNIVPVISLEGHQMQTDDRRGKGVHRHVLAAMARLRAQNIFFGTSFTLTRQNHAAVMDEAFIRAMMAEGCRVFFFVDYVPVQEGTDHMALTDPQRAEASRMLAALNATVPGLFIALPGDEEMYGGCLAAGRGFVHVNPQGRLEPCPFSPFSDVSLRELPLGEALRSRLLASIRANAEQLNETRGGCALWARREWVTSLLASE